MTVTVTPAQAREHIQPPPIPAFLRRSAAPDQLAIKAASQAETFAQACRRARKIARECNKLLERNRHRKAAQARRRKAAKRKGH
jgi:hypothetical protein